MHCRNMLWHLHSSSNHQSTSPRPSLIDLGPLALLQTALTLLASPLLGRHRVGADIASALLSVSNFRMQSLLSVRKGRGLHRGCVLLHRLVRLLIWQTLPIVVSLYAFTRQRRTDPRPSSLETDEQRLVVGPDLALADQKIPAFSLKVQCRSCLQKKQMLYDAHGYPLFLQ